MTIKGFRTTELTARELQVLHGMAAGKTNATIGKEMGLTEDTIKSHAARIYRKFDARDRANAVAIGFRLGIFDRGAW